MTPHEFINNVRIHFRNFASGFVSLYREPPGRKPRSDLIEKSKWYLSLPAHDQMMVECVVREAGDAAVFSLLCLIDGVCAIENVPDKGELELIYRCGDLRVLLNPPAGELLHDIWNRLCTELPERTACDHQFEFFDSFPNYEIYNCVNCGLRKYVNLLTGVETIDRDVGPDD